MKKLVLVCRESILAGRACTSISEIVDSLANVLNKKYEISIVCIGDENSLIARLGFGKKKQEGYIKTRFSKVNYYLIEDFFWNSKMIEIIEEIKPDILHNLAEVELLQNLSFKPQKTVYTFDNVKYVLGKEKFLEDYDIITTTSKSYAEHLLKNELSWMHDQNRFYGIDNGLLTEVFSPTKGLLMPATYNANNQEGKEKCKKKLLQIHGIQGDPYICLSAGITWEKNIDEIIAAIPLIKESGGILLLANYADRFYEKELSGLTKEDGVIIIKNYPSLLQIPALLGGCDFYINPWRSQMGNLIPLMASHFGTIPLIVPNKYEYDIFNEDNSILVENIEQAINDMTNLYNNKNKLIEKRRIAMTSTLTQNTQKQEYIKIYEK